MDRLKRYNASAGEDNGWQKSVEEFISIGEAEYLAKAGGADRIRKLKPPVF